MRCRREHCGALVKRAAIPYDHAIVRRSLIPFAFVSLVAIALSGCDVAITPGAARVGSTTISTSRLDDAMSAISGNAGFLCTLAQSNPSASISVIGAGSENYNASFAASQLSLLIREHVLSSLVASDGLTGSAADVSLATTRLGAELAPPSQSTCTIGGPAIVASMPASYRSFLLSVEVEQELVSAHLAGVSITPSALASYASAHQSAAYDVCVSAILVASLSTAATARAKIASGSSFASVARSTSIDQNSAASGGVLGCLQPSQFQPPLDSDVEHLAIGQVSQPIAFSSSYVLLEVTSRKPPTELETLNYLLNSESSAQNALVTATESSLHVAVDPRYGSWQKVSGAYEVVPPTGPALSDLLNSTAITPPALPLG